MYYIILILAEVPSVNREENDIQKYILSNKKCIFKEFRNIFFLYIICF